jgi:hypothetical protein
VSWQFKSGEPYFTLRQIVTAATGFTIPEGTQSVHVIPTNSAHFQALLIAQAADGSIDQQAVTPTVNTNGLGSQTGELAGNFLGLSLDHPTAGDTLLYLPASGEATLELRISLPDGARAELVNVKPVTTWLPGEGKNFALKAQLPSERPAGLKLFDPALWNAELALPISLEESFANGTPDASYPAVTVWTQVLKTPILFR